MNPAMGSSSARSQLQFKGMLLCSLMALLWRQLLENQKKQRLAGALRTATWTLCYGKDLDTRGSTCFSIIIAGTPSKQRQDVNAPRTRRGLCAEVLKEERFRCR